MNKRITSMDLLKGVAALFVIWIHEQFPGMTGQLINRIGSFAVPVFFMVSGFFSRYSDRGKLTKSIKHIVSLLCITYILNIMRLFICEGFSVLAVVDAIAAHLNLRDVVLFFVLNITHISGVAWFMFALLYCYILHWVFHRQVQDQRIFLLIPFCFACGMAVRFLIPSIGDHNIWFMGIPYYLCGQWFRVNQTCVVKLSPVVPLVIATTGFGILVLSLFAIHELFYLGHWLLAPSLFALAIRYPNWKMELLERVGSTYSFFVYIGHALMIHIFNAILPVGDSILLAWVRPVLLAAATIGCAALWHDVIRRKKV